MRPTWFPPRLILPLMIVVGVTIVGVRLGDIWDSLHNDTLFSAVAQAQAEDHAAAKPAPAQAPTAAAVKEEPSKDKPKEPAQEQLNLPPPPLAPREKAGGSPESELYKQLAGRREQLDKRAQEIDDREALIRVAEERVDQKIKEMESLRAQIQALIGQANSAQQAQLENLVKIYEIMKPKEAAKIFESLEMPILLGVVQRMKPARTAAVMAEMAPQKAKEITTALTKQDQLPQVK